ncbi:MAG TPA: alpha/beta hydrolase [Nocardioidaceae bacterium]|nr:alpha/beta hydrolase [Nocardioidaceae bacterium]
MTSNRLVPPAVVRRMRAGGADVRVSVRGEGPPLLLFMGIGASLELWERFEEAMAPRGRRLIAIDLPGAGASPAVFPPRRLRSLVKLAIDVLDQLGHDQVDVLGVSFGGAVAQEFAFRAPARTRRLVLCATSPGVLMVPAKPSVLVHLSTPLRYWRSGYAERIIGDIYGGRSRHDRSVHEQLKSRFERPPTALGYVGQLYAAWGWSSLPWLWRLRVPTLVMNGDDDPIIPVVNGRVLAALIPGADLRIIKDEGHLFLLEQAEESAAVIDDFLGRDARL